MRITVERITQVRRESDGKLLREFNRRTKYRGESRGKCVKQGGRYMSFGSPEPIAGFPWSKVPITGQQAMAILLAEDPGAVFQPMLMLPPHREDSS